MQIDLNIMKEGSIAKMSQSFRFPPSTQGKDWVKEIKMVGSNVIVH